MQSTKTSSSLSDGVVTDISSRLTEVEAREAARDMEIALLKKDLHYIRESTDRVTAGINRILWSIGLTALGLVVTFVMGGGLAP